MTFKGPIESYIEKIEELEDGHEIVTSKTGNEYLIHHDIDVDFLIDMVIVMHKSQKTLSNYEIRFPLARDPERDLFEYEPIPRHLLEWAIYCFEHKED